MSNDKLNRVINLIQNEKALEPQNVFNEIVPQETTEYFMVKGKLELKFQKWGSAINAFTKVTELDPENTEARNHLHLIQNILNFWNPEMFNP